MSQFDLTVLSEEDFAEHENAVLDERQRRNDLFRIPIDMAQMAQKFVDGGGNREDLVTAVTEPLPSPDEPIE